MISIACLDGIHRVDSGTVSLLQQLTQDRDMNLYDGSRLLRADRFASVCEEQQWTEQTANQHGLYKIHPAFRVIALAEPPKEGAKTWLHNELQTMFLFHTLRPMSKMEEYGVVRTLAPTLPEDTLNALLDVAQLLRGKGAHSVLTNSVTLSTRQILRIARRLERYPDEGLHHAVNRAVLSRFLPAVAKDALEQLLRSAGVAGVSGSSSSGSGGSGDSSSSSAASSGKSGGDGSSSSSSIPVKVTPDPVSGISYIEIGNVRAKVMTNTQAHLVPDIRYFDNPTHTAVMQEMLKDLELGDHLLLMGNQGVGKNKITDRFLQLLNRPREYIQLHRDTTVQSLTQQPSVKDGLVKYEDSPLVTAVKTGSVLVIDEADKAPIHVTCVLKTLIENGEMVLSNGARIVPPDFPAE